MLNGAKRIRIPLAPSVPKVPTAPIPPAVPINDYVCLLNECANDYVARIPSIEHKINVVEANMGLIPFMEDGLAIMKNELAAVKNRVNQINNILEKNNCLNIPVN